MISVNIVMSLNSSFNFHVDKFLDGEISLFTQSIN